MKERGKDTGVYCTHWHLYKGNHACSDLHLDDSLKLDFSNDSSFFLYNMWTAMKGFQF